MGVAVNRAVPTAALIPLQQSAVVEEAILVWTDLPVGRAVAGARCDQEGVEQRGRETMGEVVVQVALMTAQAEAEAPAQPGVLLMVVVAG